MRHTCPKSPLAPLFQRGENSYRGLMSPFEKGGLRGIFLANGEYNLTKTSILTCQKLANIIGNSMLSNGICS
jgi:hypothetical protein